MPQGKNMGRLASDMKRELIAVIGAMKDQMCIRDRFGIYQSILFMAASGIVWLCEWLMLILGGRDFAEAWVYIPLFTFATVFNSLSNFLNSIYMTEKRSGLSLALSLIHI